MYMPDEGTVTETRKTFTLGGRHGYDPITIKDFLDSLRHAEHVAKSAGIDTTYDDWAMITAGDGQVIISYKVEGD